MPEGINGLLRVNFSRRGFAKVVDRDGISGFTPNPLALLQFGRYLASLRLPEQGAPSFLSIPEFRGIDYVGYVIEKERLDPSNGSWKRLSEYHIIGSQSNSFKDSRVAYGQTYRYRIRSVVKFTTYNNSDALNNTQAAISLLTALQDALERAVKANEKAIRLITEPRNGLTFKSAAERTREITNAVGVSSANFFKFNILEPSSNSRLATLKTTVNSWLAKLSNSAPINYATLVTYTNELIAAGVVLPAPPKVYYSEYLASYPSRNWKYVTISQQELPPPPSSIKIIPSTTQGTISLYWLTPTDPQRDLAYFRLYRREALGQPWKLLQDKISLTQAAYVDKDVSIDKQYIYAMTSMDLHGYESFMSLQIQAQLNPMYATEKQERLLKWISGEGARPDELESVLKRFYDPFEEIVAHKNLRIAIADGFSDDNASLIVRVKSLDTHETQDIAVALRNVSK